MLDIEDVRRRATAEVERFMVGKRKQLSGLEPHLSAMAEIGAEFVASGKRLRPAFCWWAWRGCGGGNLEAAMTAAASLELFHAGALVHDDVIDDSDTRRGNPSVHQQFAAMHARSCWTGDSQRFGRAAAIVLGDECFAWADEMYSESGLPDSALLAGRPVLDAMRTEVMAGQYFDVLVQARGGNSVDESLTVARLKTAKYTIERPLQLGAVLAGGSQETVEMFSDYGLPLGEAFQLRDDILGVFGDPASTGKPAGDDLRQGKRTILVALAARVASGADLETLEGSLADPNLSDAEVDHVRDIIAASGALRTAEELIAQRTEQAVAAINAVRLGNGAHTVLAELAKAATMRAT